MIALLNLSVLGFSFVFHDKAKRTQQGNLLEAPIICFQRLIGDFQQLMGRTWRSREVAQRCLTRTSTSVRQWRTVMEVKDSCVANTLKKTIVRKQTKGNALHFCNCHGSACNKDWTSAGGEDQPTQSPPDNTIK